MMTQSKDDIQAGTLNNPGEMSRFDVESGGGAERAFCLLLMCVLAGILIIEVLLCLTPPVSRDALIHHLAIPKLWIRHGGFFETSWAPFSYFPMNIDLLYLVPLLFGNDVLPALIHMLFGWGTGCLVYQYLMRHAGRIWAMLGLLVFVSTPMVMRLSITAYVDLGMIFFTTASVLSCLRWRDGRYENTQWLLLSAVCMGLAAGTKYNALVSWLFLGGAVCFLYARDTGKQLQAIRWGALFFLVALAVVSPWLVKNLVLKGNPIYPLMDNLFAFIHGGRESAGFLAAGDADAWGYNLIRNRMLLYGEEAWQILLLPVRIFFEGRDHSPQHFDGVLSPLLALAIPFAFVGSRKGHRLFFFLFIVFVFLVSIFMADVRIRYILPILPFMTILAVMGIRNVFVRIREIKPSARQVLKGAVIAVVILLLGNNMVHLANQFSMIQPIPYITGRESRDEFLYRTVASYPAVLFINRTLPEDAIVYILYLSGRGYYLDREYLHHAWLETRIVKAIERASVDTATLSAFLKSLGGTHLLVQKALLSKAIEDNIPQEKVGQVLGTLAQCLVKLHESNGHAVYQIR